MWFLVRLLLQPFAYTENLTESEKRKLRKQAKHYVSKDNLLYYVSAKGETRRVFRETEKQGHSRLFDQTVDQHFRF
jgi:hypothetical protein